MQGPLGDSLPTGFLNPHSPLGTGQTCTHCSRRRIGHLVAGISSRPFQGDRKPPFESLDTVSLESLVLRRGKLYRVLSQHSQAVTPATLIERLVRQLGNNPPVEATEVLDRLSLTPHLEPCRFAI